MKSWAILFDEAYLSYNILGLRTFMEDYLMTFWDNFLIFSIRTCSGYLLEFPFQNI